MVPQIQIQQFTKKFNLQYFDCSAKLNINIDESFSYLAQEVKKNIVTPNMVNSNIDINQNDNNKKGCC